MPPSVTSHPEFLFACSSLTIRSCFLLHLLCLLHQSLPYATVWPDVERLHAQWARKPERGSHLERGAKERGVSGVVVECIDCFHCGIIAIKGCEQLSGSISFTAVTQQDAWRHWCISTHFLGQRGEQLIHCRSLWTVCGLVPQCAVSPTV